MALLRVLAEIAVGYVFYSWAFWFGGKTKIKSTENIKEHYREMLIAAT